MRNHGGEWDKYIKQGLLGLLICRDERLLKYTAPGLFQAMIVGTPLFQAYIARISWKITIFAMLPS